MTRRPSGPAARTDRTPCATAGPHPAAGPDGRLVAARFSIDPLDPDGTFTGWHDPRDRWNGFARPEFDRRETERVITWMHRQNDLMGDTEHPTSYAWHGDILLRTATGDTLTHCTPIPPNPRGRYPFGDDGLCWFTIEETP